MSGGGDVMGFPSTPSFPRSGRLSAHPRSTPRSRCGTDAHACGTNRAGASQENDGGPSGRGVGTFPRLGARFGADAALWRETPAASETEPHCKARPWPVWSRDRREAGYGPSGQVREEGRR
eukprot:1878464-Rhodomonas_salina.1